MNSVKRVTDARAEKFPGKLDNATPAYLPILEASCSVVYAEILEVVFGAADTPKLKLRARKLFHEILSSSRLLSRRFMYIYIYITTCTKREVSGAKIHVLEFPSSFPRIAAEGSRDLHFFGTKVLPITKLNANRDSAMYNVAKRAEIVLHTSASCMSG